MFSIEMLPANEGDALWIEYGADPVRRILIDCGRTTAYEKAAGRLGADADLKLELFVLTHVDADHISGAIRLLADGRFGKSRVGDVWFNGWRHLNGLHRDFDGDIPGVLSATQGEYFGALLRDREYPWNETFGGLPVVVEDDGPLPQIPLEGGMTLTLLGPTRDNLVAMRDRWQDDLDGSDLDPGDHEGALTLLGDDAAYAPRVLGDDDDGPIVFDELVEEAFDPDESEPNGSSISFLAEFEDNAVLFAADAHAPELQTSVERLLDERGLDRLPLDAFKMAHHGSARNNSPSLLDLLDCPRYLISTNGSRHHHPDRQAVARVIDANEPGVALFFNYKSDESLAWADGGLIAEYGYCPRYPAVGDGLKVRIS